MTVVEPVPGAPAAVVETGSERLLVIADYHAGIEAVLQSDGITLPDGAPRRRHRLLELVEEIEPGRIVVLGDLLHAIGDPWDAERDELEALFDGLSVPLTLVKGNHDGDVEPFLAAVDHDVTVTPSGGMGLGRVGFAHGHTWPAAEVVDADVVCIGHEHPTVRLEDEVGGGRLERVWLRGQLEPAAFAARYEDVDADGELVVFPAFNERSGGTWVNVRGQAFLSPFLPDGLADGEAYLLDGTRLGPYHQL